MKKVLAILASIACLANVSAGARAGAASPAHAETWIGLWQESPVATLTNAPFLDPAVVIRGTVRYRMRLSRNASVLRLRLSNELSTVGIKVSAATVAVRDARGAIVPGSLRPVTFVGQSATIIPPGAPSVSDRIDLIVPASGQLVISLFLPDGVSTGQTIPRWKAEIFPGDDATADVSRVGMIAAGTRSIVSEVDALESDGARTFVALGDSLTDGEHSDPDVARGWSDYLAIRVRALPRNRQFGIVNAGIGGNRLLEPGLGPAMLARFDRDVGAVPGVAIVFIEAGLNDIGLSGLDRFGTATSVVRPDTIISAYRELVARAHLRGIKVIGATLTPFKGFTAFYTDQKEAMRQSINKQIRSASVFDAVIDFDRVLRDPADPARLLPTFDSGDHIHPTQAGYKALGDAIDLSVAMTGAPLTRRHG